MEDPEIADFNIQRLHMKADFHFLLIVNSKYDYIFFQSQINSLNM